jgi:hypothetical protein
MEATERFGSLTETFTPAAVSSDQKGGMGSNPRKEEDAWVGEEGVELGGKKKRSYCFLV